MATLRGLASAEWGKEAVPGWSVRDLAVHVLGDFHGRLARDRDGHLDGPGFEPGESLEVFIHRNNQERVDAHPRVSPAALTDTLGLIGGQVARFFGATDPGSPSLGVSWAVIDPAPMRLDSARDFTEFWTHRQQIRHAIGQDRSCRSSTERSRGTPVRSRPPVGVSCAATAGPRPPPP